MLCEIRVNMVNTYLEISSKILLYMIEVPLELIKKLDSEMHVSSTSVGTYV